MVVPILSDCRQRKISLSTIFLLMIQSVSCAKRAKQENHAFLHVEELAYRKEFFHVK